MTLLEVAVKAIRFITDLDVKPVRQVNRNISTQTYRKSHLPTNAKNADNAVIKCSAQKSSVATTHKYDYTKNGTLKRDLPNVSYVTSKPKESILAKNDFVGNVISFSQIGSYHVKEKLNNQDSVVSIGKIKMVVDGCGGEPYSEVGARIFTQLIKEEEPYITEDNFVKAVSEIFERMTLLFNTDELIDKNLLFTIIACIETEDSYQVFCCGDGYIITYNGRHIDFIELNNGKYPHYFAYNYIKDKSTLGEYANGMKFKLITFPKSEFENIGVATDGLRFFYSLRDESQLYLLRALKNGNDKFVEKIIRSESSTFADDITICM